MVTDAADASVAGWKGKVTAKVKLAAGCPMMSYCISLTALSVPGSEPCIRDCEVVNVPVNRCQHHALPPWPELPYTAHLDRPSITGPYQPRS